MDASKFTDLLKPFPLLQMFIGGAVFLAIMAVTLKGLKENKKDAHLAHAGSDPYGLAVHANSVLVQLSLLVDGVRRISADLRDVHDEQIKTNSRLGELRESHGREMDHLRETIENCMK